MTVTHDPVTRASAVEAHPVAGLIGAEITGVDLAAGLTEAEVADVRAALLRHKVIFFRNQELTPDQQVAFGRLFGEVTPAHPTLPSIEGHPEILAIGGDDLYGLGDPGGDDGAWGGAIENNWHTDVTFVHNPPLGSILKAVETPTYGGDTAWTNLVAAYDGLSQPLKELVDGLTAVHRNEIHVELGSPQGLALRSAFTSSPYWTEHPVVRVHPETGEKALFVNPNFTSHVVGLRNKESRALLDLLYAQIADPRYTVRFRWAPGSIAFWDNRATAHLAALDAVPGEPRVLHRITIRGDVPVGPGGFESRVLEGGAFS
jgi:taurine dioxygenase